MSVVNLYNGIYKILSNDGQLLSMLGLNVSSDNLSKAKHIQKRAKPQDIIDNLPLLTFYTPGGQRENENDLVFNSTFVFDIYTRDNVELAHRIAQRILDLFDKQNHPLVGVSTFDSFFLDGYESDSNLENTYCFTVVLNMSISL